MSITFNRVPEIKSGDKIKSQHLVDLGYPINQRLRSGLGDPTWRLVWYADSIARQIRNPDASGFIYPSRSEWLEVYATIHPAEAEYPVAEAGGPEGVNQASMLGQYVFGDPETVPADVRIPPEDERLLGVPMWNDDHPPATPIERWGIAKLQRGCWDPATGAMACPVFDAAKAHYRMLRSPMNPHGNSWGGFAPTPAPLPEPCSDGGIDTPPSPNYDIFFSYIGDDDPPKPDIHFAGTCPGVEGAVAFISVDYPFKYVVGVYDGAGGIVLHDPILMSEYIEGPYSGGNTLTKQQGEHLPRVLNYFSAQYRGTSDQRAEAGTWNQSAFDTQKFFETQYLLAPAKGDATCAPGSVSPIYPLFQRVGINSISAGTKLPLVAGGTGTGHTVAAKCVVASLIVETHDLVSDCTVEVLSNGVQVGVVKLSAEATTDVLVLSAPITAGKVVEMRVTNDCTFTPGNANRGVAVEVAEIMDYKPWPHDHFLVLRLGGARIDLFNGTDGYGGDEEAAKLISNDYFRWGLIQNVRGNASNPGSADAISTNAVHEAARRLFRCVRILRPEQLVSYEVSGGKSILVFNRWTVGAGGDPASPGSADTPPPETETASGDIVRDARYTVRARDSDFVTYDSVDYTDLQGFRGVDGQTDYTATGTAKVYLVTQFLPDSGIGGVSGDCLAGIAPNPVAVVSGQIRWQGKYQVWGTTGTIHYNGRDYIPGNTFTGVQNRTDFTSTGDAAIYERDGIKHTAEPEDFTNEWLVGFQFKGFNNNEESLWKPDAYGRFFSFSDRCHFYPNPLSLPVTDPRKAMAIRQFAYGSRIWLAPEAPTAYRYALGLNQMTPSDPDGVERKKNFYKSCRLYEPDTEIEKAELIDAPTGQLVKLTMKSRFHYGATAAASFGPDPTTWNSSALRAEPYRTVDNALREWLYHKATGVNPSIKVGDSAENSQAYEQFDAPYGTVMPHIFFTKLIPLPYSDNNDAQDNWDTPFLHDQLLLAELYLRVMCEGYVDGMTSAQYGCDTGIQALYDYEFQNLCFDAFDHKWLRALPSQKTAFIPEVHTRPDLPLGFGPLPNTIAAAEQYNLFAKAVNKLTTVRVMLPSKFQQQHLHGVEFQSVQATNPDGTPRDCEAHPNIPGVIYEGSGPDPSTTPGPWEDSGSDLVAPGVAGGLEWNFETDGSGYVCDGTSWVIRAVRDDYNFRWTLVDPDAYLAIPETWRGQLDVDGSYLGLLTSFTEIQFSQEKPYELSESCNGSLGWWPVSSGVYLKFDQTNPQVQNVCGIFGNSGTVRGPALAAQVIAGGYNLGACTIPTGSDAQFTPIPNDGIALTIPLVDPHPITPPAPG